MAHDVLYFSEDNNLFYFTTQRNDVLKIRGVQRFGSSWGFYNRYPDNFLALKDWTSIVGGKASKEAITQIEKIKSIPKQIEELAKLSQYSHLFSRDPFIHQQEVVEHMLHYNRLGIILEQGLGKTFITLMYLQITGLSTIVLAPKIALRNWYREVEEFTDFKPVIYKGTPEQRHKLRSQILSGEKQWDILITNYETLVSSKKLTKDVILDWWSELSETQQQNFKSKWELTDNKDIWEQLKALPEQAFMRPDMSKVKARWDDFSFLKQLGFECIILDEGSRIKGHNSKRSQATLNLAELSDRRYILSGTLCLGDPRDVFMPMRVLNSNIFGSNYRTFEPKYCKYSPYNKHIVTGYKNLDDLKNRMDPYIIAKRREDCISLPDRMFTQVYYELSDYQQQLYTQVVDDEKMISIVKLNKLRQILSGHYIETDDKIKEMCNECPHVVTCSLEGIEPWDKQCISPVNKAECKVEHFDTAKLEALLETLEFSDEKTIIWYYYRYDRQQIEKLLKSNKYSYVHADEDNCDQKFEQGNYDVFLGQINQGISITLNSATQTIYYSHGLGLEPRLQSLDRNHRMGQKKNVLVKDFICPETVEEAVVRLLNDKEDVKNFVQSKTECKSCKHSMECLTKNLAPYQEGCIHFAQRINAEKKKHIKVA